MHINLQDCDANTDKKFLHYETNVAPIASKEDIEKLMLVVNVKLMSYGIQNILLKCNG